MVEDDKTREEKIEAIRKEIDRISTDLTVPKTWAENPKDTDQLLEESAHWTDPLIQHIKDKMEGLFESD